MNPHGSMSHSFDNPAAASRPTGRQFGRDTGDTYGRHALVNPGGDNRQIDVLRLIGNVRLGRYHLNPTRITDDYVGAHRATVDSTRWIRHDNSLARWTHGQVEVIQ